MTRTQGFPTSACLLAVVLLGAPPMQASFAAEDGGIRVPGAATSGGPVASSGGVQPHGLGTKAKPDQPRDVKIAVPANAPANPHGQPASASGPSGTVARNAIGQPVVPHNTTSVANAVPAKPSPAAETAVITAPSVPGSAAGAAKPSPGPANSSVARPNAGAIVSAPVGNRGTISGSSLAPHGSGPAVIGQQAKVVAGINGSKIQPKH